MKMRPKSTQGSRWVVLDDWRRSVVCNCGPQPDRGKGIPTSEQGTRIISEAEDKTKGNSAEATFCVLLTQGKEALMCHLTTTPVQ